MAKLDESTPVVVATHLCFEAITNRDKFVDAFGRANVILVLGGHYHKASVNRYRGFNFVQLPSPRDRTEFTVIRITSNRLVAIPYDHAQKKWTSDPRTVLDVAIKGPVRAEKTSSEK
ncbi:MAG: hypothetical protein N2C14_26905 [Planctomycetales bacterium]